MPAGRVHGACDSVFSSGSSGQQSYAWQSLSVLARISVSVLWSGLQELGQLLCKELELWPQGWKPWLATLS